MNLTASNYNKFWWCIDGVLAGMAVPFIAPERRYNSGSNSSPYEDDLTLIHRAGIRAVVSLLNHPEDHAIFQRAGFEFKCFPVVDGHPPSLLQAQEFTKFVDSCKFRSLPVLVFCVGGIGRTGTMIACYLIHTGKTAAESVAYVRSKEPLAIETTSQLSFLNDFETLQRQ
jgi:atypical dual specificity phosphatase